MLNFQGILIFEVANSMKICFLAQENGKALWYSFDITFIKTYCGESCKKTVISPSSDSSSVVDEQNLLSTQSMKNLSSSHRIEKSTGKLWCNWINASSILPSSAPTLFCILFQLFRCNSIIIFSRLVLSLKNSLEISVSTVLMS